VAQVLVAKGSRYGVATATASFVAILMVRLPRVICVRARARVSASHLLDDLRTGAMLDADVPRGVPEGVAGAADLYHPR
jgi:hypothetical protein